MPRQPIRREDKGAFSQIDTKNWSLRHGEFIWVHKLLMVGWFIGLGTMVMLWSKVVLDWQWYFASFFAVGILGLLVPYSLVRERFKLERIEWVLGSLFGLGWTAGSVLLVLNFYISTPIDFPRQKVDRVDLEGEYYLFWFESELFNHQPRFREVSRVEYFGYGLDATELEYDLRQGFLGIQVIHGVKLYKDGELIKPNN